MRVISEIQFNGDEEYYSDFLRLTKVLIKIQGITGERIDRVISIKCGFGTVGNNIGGVYTSSEIPSYGIEFESTYLYTPRSKRKPGRGTHYFYEHDKEWNRIDSLYKTTIRNKNLDIILNEG